MQTWFECVVKFNKIDDDGRERKVSESYLFDAVSYGDSEARVAKEIAQFVRGEFTIDKIIKSRIVEIFPNETGEFWYKGKISMVTIDEKAGKEKRINNYFLIAADNIKQALQRLEEGLSYVLVPYRVDSIAVSNIVDVFPYFTDKVNAPIPSNLKPIEKECVVYLDEDELDDDDRVDYPTC